ncbi:hypothetical protein EJB05_20492 [Eragrostis curvula]|uniref:Piwi domain-containing protein n=1 Tax=Eragrostis curvula TaxID=38414 RepID=A0A5J9UYZ3_9POAL|nr:hypothetical protein EJB05_20492 [Eragrostis curvula]
MATGRGAYWRELLGKMVTWRRSEEAPANVSFSGNDAVDRHDNLRNRAEAHNVELPTGETGLSDEKTGEDVGSEQIDNIAAEPASEKHAVEEGSTSIQLIGPPPPFEAFLLPGMRPHFLRAGWGTKVPYKKDSNVDQEAYSKLFDANGYYKLIGKKRVENNSNERSADSYTREEEKAEASHCSSKRKTVDMETFTQPVDVHDTTLLDSRDEIGGSGDNKEIKNSNKEKEDGGDGRGHETGAEEGPEQLDHSDESMTEDEEGSEQDSDEMMKDDDESDGRATHSDVSEYSDAREQDDEPSEKAERGIVKNWALLNFSSMSDKETTSFYCKLIRMCMRIGMDATTPNKDYLMKVAFEINEKVMQRLHKGVPQPIVPPIPFVSEAPTIIFGADISRSTPGEGSISIASVAATMHWPGMNKYKAVVSCQPYTELFIKNLVNNKEKQNGGLVNELLLAFHQNTNQWAQRIIFFRNDGIEGQLGDTFCREINAIEEACSSLEMGRVPITFVVAAQRPSHEAQGSGEMVDRSELDGRVIFEFSYSCPSESRRPT